MEALSNITRKQAIFIASGALFLVILVIAGIFFLNNSQQSEIEKQNELERQEKEAELERLQEESSGFKPTEDPEEQLHQSEVLREEYKIEQDLGVQSEEELQSTEEQEQAREELKQEYLNQQQN